MLEWFDRGAARVEWLSVNGSAYTAGKTADTARALGLTPLFTPVHSPESNGMSEAFVKTLKRDYANITILPDAATILRLLPGRIEDCCKVHPHSDLKFRSPREFLMTTPTVASPSIASVKVGPADSVSGKSKPSPAEEITRLPAGA